MEALKLPCAMFGSCALNWRVQQIEYLVIILRPSRSCEIETVRPLISESYVSRLLNLALLDPRLVELVLNGDPSASKIAKQPPRVIGPIKPNGA
jgi:hypothetical protein